MSEIKQTNFRLDQETVDRFRSFCKENNLNHAEGFDQVMQVFEFDRAKTLVPERRTEIEEFRRHVKDITSAFLNSIEVNKNAEARIHEEFVTDLARKDKTIDELREKVEQLQAEKVAAEQLAAEAVKAKDQAEKAAAAADQVRRAAEQTAEDKRTIADTLAAKLAEAEKKLDGYDDLVKALSDSEDAKRTAEQQIKDIQRDAADAAKDAARNAERTREQAVREVSATLQAQIDALKDELRKVQSDLAVARTAADTARTAAIAELAEAHSAELAELHAKLDELRAKIDARTDELMQARQEISGLQITAKAK